MRIDNKYGIDEFVYLVTDPDQFKRQICEIRVFEKSHMYRVSFADKYSDHYEVELSNEPDIALKTNN